MRQRKAKGPRWLLALLSIMLVAALVSGCGSKSKDVVATYKNGKVTKVELDKFIGVSTLFNPYMSGAGSDPQMQDMMLKQYLAIKVLGSRASDTSKKDADAKTKDQMKQFDDYYNTNKADMDKQMKDANITRQDIQDYIQNSFIVMNDLSAKVTDKQVQDSYNQKLQADPHAYDIATVSHILVSLTDPSTGKDLRSKDDALKRAQDVKAKLDAGGDFAALAKDYSDDPGSKDNGGTYANQPVSQWDPDFAKAVETLPLNKVSDPVLTQFGYHIMKVASRSTQTLDQVKDSLKSDIAQNMVNDFIDKELPTLDFKSKLPQPTPPPAASGAPVLPAPAATTSPAPAASPAK